MRNVVVAILGGGRGTRLEPLTRLRSKPAVPVAGKYRLIDIPISNAINSGMERMFVLTQFNSVSLHRHIQQTYKFDPFSRGHVEILAAQQTPGDDRWFQGTADAVRQNLRTVREMQGELVLILSGDHIYRMDYSEMVRQHLEAQAEISLAVQTCTAEEITGFGAVRVDGEGRVVEFREKPKTAEARAGMEVSPSLLESRKLRADRPYLASMGVYLFNSSALGHGLDNDLPDFGRDIIPALIGQRRVQAFFFADYWRDIGTIGAFYNTHMDLVAKNPPFDFNDPNWPFYTHPRFLPGARLYRTRFDQAILGDGTILEDSVVEHSIVGIRSCLSGATIRRSLLMGADPNPPDPPAGAPPLGIGPGSLIENAIIDKNARIGRNVQVTNSRAVREADGPGWAIRDGIVVIAKNAVIADGTVI
ncbi:MAG: glucose-1-phosphate adenylyltransferase [Acidobacteria bacterium]|nr:glucose-1-phosphate adenylyltransferase [Acidobacteriota bacterium]